MKTNQTMTIQIGKNHTVQIGKLNDVLAIGNEYREKRGLREITLEDYLRRNETWEFIVGAIWNFVILEKVEENSYRYFVSQNFDSTKIDDLKSIYKNLLVIKNEVIKLD